MCSSRPVAISLQSIAILLLASLLAPPGAEAQSRSGRNRAFTHFESFESAVENTAGDPRDLNHNGVIDCGEDNDCATITSCAENPRRCDEWTLPLESEPDLQFSNEDASGNKISFKSGAGPFFPDGRGSIEVVGPGSKEVRPGDPPIQGGILPDRLDWHIHTVNTPDIDDRLIGAPGSQPKAFRGQNSLHWGRHVRVPFQPDNQQTFGDTYCVQCMNAFILDRPGGLHLSRRATRE
jgi:hypothetical protein